MNWNQIRQVLKGSRSWNAAPSSFVRALMESLTKRSNPRRTGTAACYQMELLEIRQVLSAANPASTLNFTAVSVANDISDAPDSIAGVQIAANTVNAETLNLSGQTNLSNSDLPVAQFDYNSIQSLDRFNFTSNSVHINGNSGDQFSDRAVADVDSSNAIVSGTQSLGNKTSVSESDQLPPAKLGQSIDHYNDTSLIDTVFQDSDSILDSSPSITSPVASSKPVDETPSLTEPAVTQQDSDSVPTASEIPTPKVRSKEPASTPAMWHDAGSGNAPTIIPQHSNNPSRSWSETGSDVGTRAMGRSPATELRFEAEVNQWTSSTAGARADFETSDGPNKAAARSQLGALSNIEEFYANADLFNSPFDFIVVADTASLSTIAFITDETFPIAVPRLTPETATAQSTQNLPNMSPTRCKQLREGHRQYTDIVVVSTDVLQHDGTPEWAASENIPRQLKHVVLPRGPPRKQPNTVLRIMDSDAEAHVLQRLRYSIAPRGPSTVTVEMQSPEECSFSGPRVSPEETCRVQLAC